jgi:2-(1,2-epoxy-1,2-dihydrophenyl)acetyl-CoA isomerase
MNSTDDAVLMAMDGGVLTVTLNSPRVRNALIDGIEAGLARAAKEANGSKVRSVILTGNGPAFCAGANMKELDENEERDAGTLRARAREIPESVLLPLARIEKPVIVALNGAAVGAGIGLALTGDYRVCAQSSSFIFAFLRLGLAPDLGIAWTLPRLIGYQAARDLLFRGQTVTAEEAFQLGLADKVVPDDDLAEAAKELACELAEGPTLALGATKTLLRRGAELDLERFLDYEVLAQSMLVGTEDHREAVNAHGGRRAPKFRGR